MPTLPELRNIHGQTFDEWFDASAPFMPDWENAQSARERMRAAWPEVVRMEQRIALCVPSGTGDPTPRDSR